MRLMILRAALLAAEDVQTSGLGTSELVPSDPAVDAPAPVNPEPTPDVQASAADQGDPADVPGPFDVEPDPLVPPASSSSSSSAVSDPNPPPALMTRRLTAELCMPVIVRQSGVLAAAMVVEEDQGTGISVQVFRGDHHVHAAHHVSRANPKGTDDGWFYPWERDDT
jgi:hypothetical protein